MSVNPASSKRTASALALEDTYVSADERRAKGKSLRDAVPRASHAGWKAQKGRRDPIDLLRATNAGRVESLIPIRFGRMSTSPFAFYRGSAALMAADLDTTPTSGLRVQACGDAHLMNFGAFATPERNVIFDINDLDETLPASFEWDLKRLAASVVIAAQYLQLPDSDTARAARKRIADRIKAEKRRTVPDHLYPKLVSTEGAKPRIKDDPPLIFHADAEDAARLESGLGEVIAAYRETLPEHTRTLFDRFHFFDIAFKVVGVGSVGTQCTVCLFMASDDDPLFLQVKEARASVLEPYAGKSVHPNHGQRVVVGQRLMQAATDVFLGWTRGKNGRDVYVRQLRDMKMSAIIEDWDAVALRHYARLCARALSRAHARTGDAAMISGYMGSGQTFDDAIGEFAVEYADQNRADYRAFVRAIREGRIEAMVEG